MATFPNSVLDAPSLFNLMVKSLPPEASSPVVKDSYAAVALFVHACMLAVGFRLVGLGEDHKIDVPSESKDVSSLPAEWDASSTYAFRYVHAQSSMDYVIKISRLGGKALVFATALPDDETASFEIKVQDYISEASIKGTDSRSDVNLAVKNIFISDTRVEDLSSLVKINILQKLAPGIRKESYEETFTTTGQPPSRQKMHPPERDPLRDDGAAPARPYPFEDPLAAAPRLPLPHPDFPPPDFEDEYEMNRPPRFSPGYGERRPLNIGERDLYPPGLGPHDPLRIGPGGGGFGGGGGMHPTFDDPLFAGRGGVQPHAPRAPPGARYDPVGPGDGPPHLRGGSRFPTGRGGGGMGNPFAGFGGGDFI